MIKIRITHRGMTLTETVIVIGIFTMLSLVIFTSIASLYQTNSYVIGQSYEVDNARRGLDAWMSDAREMTYADNGAFPVAIMEPHRFGFYSDIDADPSVEFVIYELSTTTFYRYTYKATGSPPTYSTSTVARVSKLSEYVQNLLQGLPVFSYFDTNGVLLTATSTLLTDVRYIETGLIVNIDPLRSPGEFLLQNGISPRNLKDNL
jgi:hypothetical protein